MRHGEQRLGRARVDVAAPGRVEARHPAEARADDQGDEADGGAGEGEVVARPRPAASAAGAGADP